MTNQQPMGNLVSGFVTTLFGVQLMSQTMNQAIGNLRETGLLPPRTPEEQFLDAIEPVHYI